VDVAVARGPVGEEVDLAASLTLTAAEVAALTDTHVPRLEAEEALRAIRHGEVDALVVSRSVPGEQVFTLSSADRPYRIFVENMQKGAATLSSAGIVLFANERLGNLLGCPATEVVARHITEFVAEASRTELLAGIDSATIGATLELDLLRPDGRRVAALAGISCLDVDDERLICLTFADLTAERRLLREVSASRQRFEALYRGAPVPAYTWQATPAGLVLIDYNEAAAQRTGEAAADALGSVASAYFREDPQLPADMTRCLAEQIVVERESVLHGVGTGEDQHFHVTMVPLPPDLVVVHTQDVTKSRIAERALRTSEERYRTIVENAQEGISILDDKGRFVFANSRTAELLGHNVDALVGMEASLLLGSLVTWVPAPGTPATAQYEVAVARPDGSSTDLLVSTAPLPPSDSGDAGSLCMVSDVSGLRRAEGKLAHWALSDALTGLPNRSLLMDRIDQALTRRRRQTGAVAALFCDIDGLQEVNDSFGHQVGDRALQAVAARLRAAVRPADTVARIGGDEFVVLCEDMMDESPVFGLASRVLLSVAEPLRVAGHELSLSVSVGVAFATSGDSAELLRNADAAMYLAKQRGRNRAELFDEQLRQAAADRISLIADLRHAVARGELRLHYQPVLALDGEDVMGVEALVRWQHPRLGLIFPDKFIPAAESAGLIDDIGAWVLRTSCRQAATWARAGAGGAPLHMAVNVSARQLAAGGGFVQLVADVLREAQIDPATLILEVTESVVMDDPEATLDILTELKALGVRLAIDDFGTGYSSLVYLKRFPVDQLKVDRAFVSGLGDDPDDSAIVASVVGLAHAVGIVAVAEGVETAQQLAALQRLGCGFGQGYLWSKAGPAAELDQAIRTGVFAMRKTSEASSAVPNGQPR